MRIAYVVLFALGACARSAERGPEAPTPRTAPRPAPAIRPSSADSAPPPQAAAPAPPAAAAPADPLATEAAKVVDRQNEAYNRHGLEAFLATYADGIAVHTLGDTTVFTGKARLREITSTWFAEAPGARTEVVQRMAIGRFVVDRQRVTGTGEAHSIDAIGIYEVREGLIRRVWTIPPPPTPH
jgi:hypothetical protein